MERHYNYARQALEDHFGAQRLSSIVTSRRQFASHVLPDLQSALIAEADRYEPVLFGLHQSHPMQSLHASAMLIMGDQALQIAPVQRFDVDIGTDQPFSAISNGLWLFEVDGEPVGVILSRLVEPRARYSIVEVITLPQSVSFTTSLFETLTNAAKTSQLYRGKTLSFESASDYSGMRSDMLVHRVPPVSRDKVILEDATLQRVERHVLEHIYHRQGLRELGQSTRKGILLYGPPGTGKTHLIRYLTSQLPEHTTILVTAEQVANLGMYMTMARALQPSVFVLEDVDLIGRSREGMGGACSTEATLNRLLNEMDGLGEEAEILFILTTNRPGAIEEALASRPGRIDEAIEVPLPDADCRARLLALYGKALTFEEGTIAATVAATQGASASFMKELVRRFAQFSLACGKDGRVPMADAAAVVGDALGSRTAIGGKLLGFHT
ncbi:AAA family ATPase [Peristeroidobacter soli]|uniref:AAA family ATPase n=1 Tax=Peristeroidobacter soli TaxID=2497877 RepID=UPI00101CA69B|nr:ATP-binding protein [Peristeroidobacter soli]